MDLLLFRRANLQVLMEERGMNKTEFARVLNFSRPYLSRLFTEDNLFGSRTARAIERHMKLPFGFLDADHDLRAPNSTWETPDQLGDLAYAVVENRNIHRRGLEGDSNELGANLRPLYIRKDYLVAQKVTSRSNLFVVTAPDASMSPTLEENGVALIDVGQLDIVNGEIYLLRMNDDQSLRRLIGMFGGDLILRVDNSLYKDQIVAKSELSRLEIVGRVIWRSAPTELIGHG